MIYKLSKSEKLEDRIFTMRIAICDDEQNELHYLHALVERYNPKIDVFLFLSAESLLESMNTYSFDIILLDIEMEGTNGYTAAKRLKTVQNPPLIVFITNSAEYTYRGYEVAFRYLPKPVTFDVLSDVLSSAIEQIVPLKLTINENGRTHVIHINDILYIESSGHKLAIHTKGSIYECHMKLCEVESLLPVDVFTSPHKGYLVNLDCVDSIRESRLTLKGDVHIPVSRRRKKEFEQALFRFVRRLR